MSIWTKRNPNVVVFMKNRECLGKVPLQVDQNLMMSVKCVGNNRNELIIKRHQRVIRVDMTTVRPVVTITMTAVLVATHEVLYRMITLILHDNSFITCVAKYSKVPQYDCHSCTSCNILYCQRYFVGQLIWTIVKWMHRCFGILCSLQVYSMLWRGNSS